VAQLNQPFGTAATTGATPGATPVPNKGAGTTAAKAEIKKPPFWLFAIVGVLLLGLIGYIAFSALSGKSSKPTSQNNTAITDTNTTPSGGVAGKPKTPVKQTSLIYWGLWEPSEVMTSVITDFETANPQYKIDYRKQSHKDYRERLQTAIASGNGPDFSECTLLGCRC
jgi:ABC-type glycerol-3-phosphate transport system substrate-binding protein